MASLTKLVMKTFFPHRLAVIDDICKIGREIDRKNAQMLQNPPYAYMTRVPSAPISPNEHEFWKEKKYPVENTERNQRCVIFYRLFMFYKI